MGVASAATILFTLLAAGVVVFQFTADSLVGPISPSAAERRLWIPVTNLLLASSLAGAVQTA